jgi:hypothetical protein
MSVRPSRQAAAVWRRLLGLGQEAGQRPSFLLRLRHRGCFFPCGRAHRRLLSPLLLPPSPAGSRCLFSSTVSSLLHRANRSEPPPSLLCLHLSPPFLCASDPSLDGGHRDRNVCRLLNHTFECTDVAPLLPAIAPPGAAPTPALLARRPRPSPAWSALGYPAAACSPRRPGPRVQDRSTLNIRGGDGVECHNVDCSHLRAHRSAKCHQLHYAKQFQVSDTFFSYFVLFQCFVHLWSTRIIEICFATLTSLCVRLPV